MKKGRRSQPRATSLRAGAGVGVLACFLGCGVASAQYSAAGETTTGKAWDSIKWTFDGEVSQGITVRAHSINYSLIGPLNGGTASNDLSDSANLNYPNGRTAFLPSYVLGTVEAEYQNYRMLIRGSYQYDWQVMNGDTAFVPLDDNAKENIGNRLRLLDAYVSGTYRPIEDNTLEVKVGNQTIAWGEAKFLSGGIAMLNTFDLAKLRRPGATLKDGMLPVAVAAATWQTPKHLTFQAFYQLVGNKQELDPAGTFHSDSDLLGAGAGTVVIAPGVPPLPRSPDRVASQWGQFGVAAFVDLPGVNLGFYYQQLRQRTSKISQLASGQPFDPMAIHTSYQWDFPKDVQTVGASFQTGLGSAALAGEIAYRHNFPIGLDPAAVGLAAANSALCQTFVPEFGFAPNCPAQLAGPTPLRADSSGYVQGWVGVDQLALNLNIAQVFTGSNPVISFLRANGGAVILETNAIHTSQPNQAVTPTAVTNPWYGNILANMSMDYYRVYGSEWTVTPKLIAQYVLYGSNVDQSPFFKGRLFLTPALQIHRDTKPDVSFEIAYTNISDHSSKGAQVLSDRDYVQASLRWAF